MGEGLAKKLTYWHARRYGVGLPAGMDFYAVNSLRCQLGCALAQQLDGSIEASAGHGPENVPRLRRFAVGVIKSKGASNVAQKMRKLNKNIRLVFDYLRMTKNSCAPRNG